MNTQCLSIGSMPKSVHTESAYVLYNVRFDLSRETFQYRRVSAAPNISSLLEGGGTRIACDGGSQKNFMHFNRRVSAAPNISSLLEGGGFCRRQKTEGVEKFLCISAGAQAPHRIYPPSWREVAHASRVTEGVGKIFMHFNRRVSAAPFCHSEPSGEESFSISSFYVRDPSLRSG